MLACTGDADLVDVQLYGEALCPYCMRFTTTIVAPLLKQGVGSIFNFTCEPVHVCATCQACNGDIQLRQAFTIPIYCLLSHLLRILTTDIAYGNALNTSSVRPASAAVLSMRPVCSVCREAHT